MSWLVRQTSFVRFPSFSGEKELFTYFSKVEKTALKVDFLMVF